MVRRFSLGKNNHLTYYNPVLSPRYFLWRIYEKLSQNYPLILLPNISSEILHLFTEREQLQPPKFVERMQNYTIKEGQSVTLTARAVGTPTPMISWQKNNKMLTPNKDYK